MINIPEQKDLLDHGYVRFIEKWGSDERIIESARMSTSKGFLGWEAESTWECPVCHYTMVVPHNDQTKKLVHPCDSAVVEMHYVKGHNGDERLLRFLYDNKHMSPFEQAGLTFEVQAPIFVFREWHRHRTQSYNEMSARYTALPDLFYMPSEERIKHGKQSSTNKQSSDIGILPMEWKEMTEIQSLLLNAIRDARDVYEELLKLGVAREIARIVIPVAQYSRMRASANLRNWLHFLSLRMDPAAQWEIRQFANAVGEYVELLFPRTSALFREKK